MDNGSTDGTAEFIKKNYPKVNFYEIPNVGVDVLRNYAFSKSESEYMITLDSDAALSKDWIKKAVEYMDEHTDVGICCGKLLNDDGRIDYAGTIIAKNGGVGDIGHGKPDNPEYNTFKRISGMTTAASIIRKKMIDEIGGFDENYYYGHEDAEFGLRANIAGWKVVYNPDLIGIHSYHSSGWKKTAKGYKAKKNKFYFYDSRNSLLTILKNLEQKIY